VVVHSALPEALTLAAAAPLRKAGVQHRPHGDDDPVGAAAAAAADPEAVALIGPFRSEDVRTALDITAPAGLALLAPMATAAQLTHDDEPGCDGAADHRGTILRLVARDTEVARCIALDASARGERALVIAGAHEYGVQLEGQLHLSRLPLAADVDDAQLLVLCGLVGEPEIDRAANLAPLPIVAFDGVQGADLGAGRSVRLALPFAPDGDTPFDHLAFGEIRASEAGDLVVSAVQSGAADRRSVLAAMRAAGAFDEHGDLRDPPIWLWTVDGDWIARPERRLPDIS
jgi:hypothetical protein